jgi:hypothetical protein
LVQRGSWRCGVDSWWNHPSIREPLVFSRSSLIPNSRYAYPDVYAPMGGQASTVGLARVPPVLSACHPACAGVGRWPREGHTASPPQRPPRSGAGCRAASGSPWPRAVYTLPSRRRPQGHRSGRAHRRCATGQDCRMRVRMSCGLI